jgi:hypothetical protein
MSLVSRPGPVVLGSVVLWFSNITACSSAEEHASEEREVVGSKPTGRANQGVAQLAERRRAMPEAAGAEPASLTNSTCPLTVARCPSQLATDNGHSSVLGSRFSSPGCSAASSAPARDAGGRRGGASQPDQWVASSKGKTLALQARDPGSSPGASTIRRFSSTG